jgi:DNA topoisomerase VI subunit B
MSAAVQRTTFTTSRLSEFCSVKELVAQTGTAPADWPLMIARELVDNALDHAEEVGIAPVIRVTVARGRIRVRDNGLGIPPETVGGILDFSSRTSSRSGYISPSRGQQGAALALIIAIPFALSGEEARVDIEACGIRHEIIFRVDQVAQAPAIEHRQIPGSVRTGTSITVWWPESAWSELAAAGPQFLPLLSHYTDLNPHLSIRATWVDEDRRERWPCPAADPGWKKWVPSTPTSPHGIAPPT